MTPRREPALLLALVAAVIQLVSAFIWPLTTNQQGVLNALIVAAAGLVTAFMVRSDHLAPAILGFLQAAIAVGVSFGLHLTDVNQSVIMTILTAIVGMFVRTQVTAPVPPQHAMA